MENTLQKVVENHVRRSVQTVLIIVVSAAGFFSTVLFRLMCLLHSNHRHLHK